MFDAEWRELMRGCKTRGFPYDVGIRFPTWAGEDELLHRTRAHNISLNVGDVYIFNSNHVHRVNRVPDGPPRLVLGTFVGYHRDSMHVWS